MDSILVGLWALKSICSRHGPIEARDRTRSWSVCVLISVRILVWRGRGERRSLGEVVYRDDLPPSHFISFGSRSREISKMHGC